MYCLANQKRDEAKTTSDSGIKVVKDFEFKNEVMLGNEIEYENKQNFNLETGETDIQEHQHESEPSSETELENEKEHEFIIQINVKSFEQEEPAPVEQENNQTKENIAELVIQARAKAQEEQIEQEIIQVQEGFSIVQSRTKEPEDPFLQNANTIQSQENTTEARTQEIEESPVVQKTTLANENKEKHPNLIIEVPVVQIRAKEQEEITVQNANQAQENKAEPVTQEISPIDSQKRPKTQEVKVQVEPLVLQTSVKKQEEPTVQQTAPVKSQPSNESPNHSQKEKENKKPKGIEADDTQNKQKQSNDQIQTSTDVQGRESNVTGAENVIGVAATAENIPEEVRDPFYDNIIPKPGHTVLHAVALTCKPEDIKKVAAEKPELLNELTVDDKMQTAMTLVIRNCTSVKTTLKCLDALQNARVDVLCAGKSRETAIYYAIKRNEYKLIEYFLRRGSSPNTYCNGKPILHHAMTFCTEASFPRVFKLLIDYGAKLIAVNDDNRMAVHEAASINKTYLVRTICTEFANELMRRTPQYQGLKFITDEILKNETKMYGASPLLVAAKFNNRAVFTELIRLGANVNACDYYAKKYKFYNSTII